MAQCYQKAGIQLTENINFCSPGDIERSDYLVEQPEMVYRASEEDVAHAQGESPHTQHTKNAVNFVRNALSIFENYGIKTVGSPDGEVVITTLNDITLAVYENRNKPGLDEEITEAMRLSGYLDHIDLDRQKNPYRYDLMLFSQKVEVHGNENKTLEILRHELKKEQDVVEVRLRSYLAGRHNLNSGLKFNELEFTIAHGLLKGMLERVIIIEKYTVTKRNDVRFKMINVACNRIIQNITMKAPELKYIVRALN